MFKCDCCGLCCRNIRCSTLYIRLDRGDGTCKFFDDEKSLCSIYENRPVECNVDVMYDMFFADKMPKEDYFEWNYAGCRALKEHFLLRYIDGGKHV